MDDQLRRRVAELQTLDSSDAAAWLIEHYPIGSVDWGDAVAIIPHLSWKKADQRRLADHYLQRIPYAQPAIYQSFASIMTVPHLVAAIDRVLPTEKRDRSLLMYHLKPILTRAAKSHRDLDLVAELLAKLSDQ